MDDKWFRAQQKRVNVTAEDIAREMGRARSNVSHIYSGKQAMSMEWAKAFAKVLQVPLDEVLRRAGVLEEPQARQLAPGFSDSDAAPFTGTGGTAARIDQIALCFGGGKPGIDVWQVRSPALHLCGYLPGDYLLVDTHQSELCRAGDVVLAQKYDWQAGDATTLLRRLEPPVLVAASTDPDTQRVHVVDGANVVIAGKVVASWRMKAGN